MWEQPNFRKSRVKRVGEDPRDDVRVGVGVGVVECQLYPCTFFRDLLRDVDSVEGRKSLVPTELASRC